MSGTPPPGRPAASAMCPSGSSLLRLLLFLHGLQQSPFAFGGSRLACRLLRGLGVPPGIVGRAPSVVMPAVDRRPLQAVPDRFLLLGEMRDDMFLGNLRKILFAVAAHV